MHSKPNVLAIVLAGGRGSRLQPLTSVRCKPALPFEGCRIIDFVLSNLVNSGIGAIHVLAQYRSGSLIDHLRMSWGCEGQGHRHGIRTVTPATSGSAGFKGTADAVFQNIRMIEQARPDLVAVFSADHVYRMDVRQMIAFHCGHRADATVATLPVRVDACSNYGIVDANPEGRIQRFHEKPVSARPMQGSSTHVLASMGNYIFDPAVLIAALRRMHAAGQTDFGTHVLPSMVASHALMAYNFMLNEVPGGEDGEERGYWRDVGTLDAYFRSCMETRGQRPSFRIDNPFWPVHGHSGRTPGIAARDQPHIAAESVVVLGDSCIDPRALVRNAIIDQGNHIPCGERIGFDSARDRSRFHVTAAGVVVVQAGYFPSGATARPRDARMGVSVPLTGLPASSCHG